MTRRTARPVPLPAAPVAKTRRRLEIVPASAERWADLERLFGERGACGGCWCMTWRLAPKEFAADKGEKNRRALLRIVASGEPSGVLGYLDGEAVGWCAVAPRESYPRLAASRVLASPDERPVWSVSCLFVARAHRNAGLSAELLAGAARYAASRGARLVEGYPHDLDGVLPAAFVWTGLLPAFERAGFREVARRSAKRPIVRLELESEPIS